MSRPPRRTQHSGSRAIPAPIRRALAGYSDVRVIVSPPRCSSTAFARVLWGEPSVRFYSHEPFEICYFDGAGLDAVGGQLADPVDLGEGDWTHERAGLVVKEMPYQVGDHFELLTRLTDWPVAFLIRDPRLSIASRRAKKLEAGEDPGFPLVETGWELLAAQVDLCRRRKIPYFIVDAADFRNQPQLVFPAALERLGLGYEQAMLSWPARPDLDLDNLGGRHRHLYRAVLESTGIEPEPHPAPPVESFPVAGGWRDHVASCVDIYEMLRAEEARIRLQAAGPSIR